MKKFDAKAMREKLRRKQGNKCCYCGCELTDAMNPKHAPDSSVTLEHLKRKQDGGTNEKDNLAASCRGCNVRRGPMDWLTYKSFVMGELCLGDHVFTQGEGGRA